MNGKVSQLAAKMIDFSAGNLHDINHLMKVYAYARTIGVCEGLDDNTQMTLEVAALLHDIACPLCREMYGNTNGAYQEKEGGPLAAEFLKDSGLDTAMIERVVYLVSHHHTPSMVDGIDYQILLEADYLVNADESHYTRAAIQAVGDGMFRTGTGKALLKTMYQNAR